MLKQFLDDFLKNVTPQLPYLLNVVKMDKPQCYDNYAVLVFDVDSKYMLEEVMDMLKNVVEIEQLYHHVPSDQTSYGHSTCFFSNPKLGRLFKINAKTEGDGKVRHVYATIYSSSEPLLAELRLELASLSSSGEFKYKCDEERLLLDFM